MLPQKKFPGRERGLAHTLTITPFFVMPVAVTLFRRSAVSGLLGQLTNFVGLPRVNRLGDQSMLSIIMITSWR
jgi:sorbitol/mannitol transport system permease protein